MTSHTEPRRYEIKVPCRSQYLPQVEAWIRLHPAFWQVAYPPRQVNNIYFDTADCQSLNENLNGVGFRGKLRLRWYGPTLNMVTGARLELKYREGTVGWKKIWPLDVALNLDQLDWHEACRKIRDVVNIQAGLSLAHRAHPVLINHYQRAYYVSSDQMVRLTIDSRLHAYNQRFSHRPNLRRPAPIADRIIVELKASADRLPCERLADTLAHLPIRPDRHSKYVLGMLASPDFDGADLL